MTDLGVAFAGVRFQNPILLASGTAAFGRALDGVMHLDELGGIVTKAVSVAPRPGNSAPRVAELEGGMLNAVGLANPGVDEVLRTELPWLARHLSRARVIVNVVGSQADEFGRVIRAIEEHSPQPGSLPNRVAGFELNVSCPNVRTGGTEFGADHSALRSVVGGARDATRRPILVKLSPTLSRIDDAARVAADSGADGITVVNTLPGLLIDLETRRPRIGFGSGGVSGSALLPVGVLATHRVCRAVALPVVGVGGVATAEDALQYMMAGASLVGVGTAALRDPRAPERILRGIQRWCERRGVTAVTEITGSLEWNS